MKAKNIFKDIPFWGTELITDFELIKHIISFNKINFILVFVALIVSSVYRYFGLQFNADFTLFVSLCFVSSLILVRHGYFNTARILFLLVFNAAAVVNGVTIGQNSHVCDIFYALAVLPFLIFKNKEYFKIGSMVLLSITLRFVCITPYFKSFNLHLAPESLLIRMPYILNFITFFIIIKIINDFLLNNEYSQQKIILKNNELEILRVQQQALINSTMMGIISLDSEGKIKFANEMALNELDYSLKELINAPISLIYHKEDSTLVRAIDDRKDFACEYDYLWRKDGVAIPVSLCMGQMEMGRTSEKRPVLFFQNIKERIANQELIEEAKQKHFHIDKINSISNTLLGVSHEIKNPLNILFNYLHVVQMNINDFKDKLEKHNIVESELHNDFIEISSSLAKMESQTLRIREMLKRMEIYTSINSSENRSVQINDLVQFAIDLFQREHVSQISENFSKITIELDLSPTVPLIDINPQIMIRSIMNILENSYEALLRKQSTDNNFRPVIKVSTELNNNEIYLSIRDNGTGIPIEILESVFQPFFTTRTEGLGLGLSFVKQAIEEEVRGSVAVKSVKGEYTDIKMTIPISS